MYDFLLSSASLSQGVMPAEPLKVSEMTRFVYFVFYPGDFTFVCPTEMFDLSNLLPEFEAEGVAVVPVSPDSAHVHEAWLRSSTSVRGLAGMVNLTLYSDTPQRDSFRTFFTTDAERSDVMIDVGTGECVFKRTNHVDVGRDFAAAVKVARSVNSLRDKPGHFCTASFAEALPKGGEAPTALQDTPEEITSALKSPLVDPGIQP